MINQFASVVSSFHIVDIVCTLFLIFMAIRGIFRGFIITLFNNLALWGGIVCSLVFSSHLAPIVKNNGVTTGASVVSFLIIFITFYLIVKLVEHFVLKITQIDSFNNLDKALGFFLGLFQGFAIIVLIYVICQKTIFSYLKLDQLLFEKSYFASLIDIVLGALFNKSVG